MEILIQLTINFLILGAIYSLVALGFSLIYSVNKFFHFAHGAIITFSAYVFYFCFSTLQINFWVSIFASIILSMILGIGMDFLVYKKLREKHANKTILLLSSISLLILVGSFILLFFGAETKVINSFGMSRGMNLFGAIITPLQIVIILASIFLFCSLFLFMNKTKTGKAMRAVADNKFLVSILGICPERMYRLSLMIGSLMAGIVGILFGLDQNITPFFGEKLVLKGLVATIVGGYGNLRGAFIGAFFIAFIETLVVWFLPFSYKDVTTFTILLLFLVFKYGRLKRESK